MLNIRGQFQEKKLKSNGDKGKYIGIIEDDFLYSRTENRVLRSLVWKKRYM